METKKLYLTNKLCALNWLNKDFVMCNDLPKIDPELFDDVRRSTLGEEHFTPTKCPCCGSEDIKPEMDANGEPTGDWVCMADDDECGYTWDPEDERHPEDEDNEEEYYPYDDFFQYFITNLSEEEVEFMCKHFSGFAFAYSPLLDCWVWCATDLGTSRDYVMVDTDLECAERKEGQPKDLPKTGYYMKGIFDYLRFDWNETECKTIFPEEHLVHLWDKYQHMAETNKDTAFAQFFNALDSENRARLIDRITEKRYLR